MTTMLKFWPPCSARQTNVPWPTRREPTRDKFIKFGWTKVFWFSPQLFLQIFMTCFWRKRWKLKALMLWSSEARVKSFLRKTTAQCPGYHFTSIKTSHLATVENIWYQSLVDPDNFFGKCRWRLAIEEQGLAQTLSICCNNRIVVCPQSAGEWVLLEIFNFSLFSSTSNLLHFV